MATKLPVNYGNAPIAKGLWNLHQENEYTHVDNYKEALCWMCWKKKASAATLIDACERCCEKKGYEAVLVKASETAYGHCQICGNYQWNIFKLNVRVCQTCGKRVSDRIRDVRRGGGFMKSDPFWKSMRRKFGQDYKLLFRDPSGVGI